MARIAREPGAAAVRGWFSAESFLGAVGVALAILAPGMAPRQVTGTAAGPQLACGAGATVLALRALVGPAPRALAEVAVLVMGACAFFTGSVLAARLASALGRRG